MPAGISEYVNLGKETYSLRELFFIRPGLVCRGAVCFTVSLEGQEDVTFIFKTTWRSRTNSSEGKLLATVQNIPEIIKLARIRSFDETPTISRGRLNLSSTGRLLPLDNHSEEVRIVMGSNRGTDVRIYSRLMLKDKRPSSKRG